MKPTSFNSFGYKPLTTSTTTYSVDDIYENCEPLYKISLKKFAIITTSFPLASFLFCVFWSIIFQFKETTATHCNVINILPSLSAATGAYSPQKHVWVHSIAIHTIPRVIVFYMYYKRHKSLYILILNVLEVFCLLGLAVFGSRTHYVIHARCFTLFLITASIYMFIGGYSSRFLWCRRTRRTKQIMAWTNLLLTCLAGYFFVRHASHCEPYVYTLFALSEYLIVLNNIYFHFLAYYDLGSIQFAFFTKEGIFVSLESINEYMIP